MLSWRSVYTSGNSQAVQGYEAQQHDDDEQRIAKLEAMMRGGKTEESSDEKLLARKLKELNG